jgi:dipeptidyl aminopeptidase/acylaminoacyl peptidase
MVDTASSREMAQTMQARYERARHLLRGAYSDQVVFNDVVYPTWIDDTEIFWYIRVIKEETGVSHEVRIVDANEKTNRLAFDNNTLAMALGKVTDKKLKAKDLKFLQSYPGWNIVNMEISLKSGLVRFNLSETSWAYNLLNGEIRETQRLYPREHYASERVSPDGTKVIYIKDYNVWIRDVNSGKEQPLSSDGEEYNAYQVNFSVSTLLIGHWSPDGKQFLIIQHDTRQVEETLKLSYKTEGDDFRPSLNKLKGVAIQGDKQVSSFRYVAINVDTGKVQKPDYPQIANEWMFLYDNLVWWGKGSRLAYFVDTDRYHKTVRLVEFDTQTGTTRVLFEEAAATFFRFAHGFEEQPVMIPLPETEELLWFSERSGWGHLYLYDLKTGELKNTVTTGEWLVRNVVHYEATRREVFLQTAGRDASKDPYYCDLVRVNIDTGELVALAESNHDIQGYSARCNHTNEWGGFKLNGVSPAGNYAVVTLSRVDTVPVTYLLGRQGERVMTIEEADISRLPKGFQWPEPVKTVSADGKTAIYGVVYRPSDFSADKSYPVVNQVMNTPHTTFAAKSAFNVHQWTTCSAAAIAELGFVVVQFDGRGTPGRSKAFQDESYGDFYGASDLSDHVVGIRQLGERYPYLDLDRVGIVSEMFGNGASWGMLKYPDFYKVGVEARVLDMRMMPAYFSDQYTGSAGINNNLEQLAGNLKGKLLLPVPFTEVPDAYGLLPIGQIILAGAFAKANKDIDLLHDPSQSWGVSTYHIRRCWDYLVQYLQGNVPPDNFILNGTALWDAGVLDQALENLDLDLRY